ncbi:MAG: tetratricopeptide repeat protein [Opitutales bacterium]
MNRADHTSTPAPNPGQGPAARLWLYRLLALAGIPGLLLLGLEGGLRLAGYGHAAGFLIPDTKPGWYRTNPDFLSSFMPEGFDLRPLNFRVAARKPANTVRIVVLGESAAEGIPAPEFGFVPQLRALLRARYPGKDIEVINTGLAAINSHVVYQITRDLADFSPDLFVVYLGNNEVVGPYGPGCYYLSEMPPLSLIRLSVFVRSTRSGQLLGAMLGKLSRRGLPPAEWGGMSKFAESAVAGDDPRLETVYRNFETNLTDIVRAAHGAGAKTLLCTVVSNLKDCAPLLSRHRAGLAGTELAEWQRVFNRGAIEWRLGETAAARADLAEARRLDPQYADTLFMLGSLALQASETEKARALFVDAEHWDALRFRPDPRINEIVRRVARGDPAVGLLDAAMQLGSDPVSTAPLAGRELLFEHVHMNWDGNYQLARAMAEETEAVLWRAAPSRLPWLDSSACAAALAYSAYERHIVLGRVLELMVNPPFTNQLTFCEEQTILAQALVRAQTDGRSPAGLQRARAMVQAAALRDPDNPTLAKIEEDIDRDLGDFAGALEAGRKARRLQPDTISLAMDEAVILSRLGRFQEAGSLLQTTRANCPPRYLTVLAPAFVDFFLRAERREEGRRYLETMIAGHPADHGLLLLRGRVSLMAGDTAAAEKDFRDVLAADPRNQEALETLVAWLVKLGQPAAANQLSLALAEQQPGNQANDRRTALLAEARGDIPGTIRYLLAAERCGPVTSAFEMHLARKFFEQGRMDEAMDHLGEARQIAPYEGDPAGAEAIARIIAKLRAQPHRAR